MKRLAVIAAVILAVIIPGHAYAMDLPDTDPTISRINAFQNVLGTGDFLIIIEENTPYATLPDYDYSEAYIWKLKSTDGTTEYAQALGYNYNDNGYGYNVISFYLNSDNVTALMGAGFWEQPYVITQCGTPAAFEEPPVYNFVMSPSDYSSLTDTDEVKLAIAQLLLDIGADLDNKWGLSTDYSLLYSGETAVTLSIYGQSFFRGAIYGVQAMAPTIFPLAINNVNTEDRTWTTTYSTSLASQYSGTYLEDAFAAGESFFDVSYNLMGILLVLGICAFIIFGNWYLGGGNIWRGLVESAPALVIGSRLTLIPYGEMGLIEAVCWLFISAKVWRLI